MKTQTSITEKIQQAISPDVLQVENESHMHNVPANSETHFKVTVVSKAFEGKRLLQRHRLLNGLLREELEGPVHALALHTYTQDEWQKKNGQAPDSPNCMGGDKSAR